MLFPMIILLFCILAPLPIELSVASPVTVAQPLNNQLPLIARTNQPFSWSPSPVTFRSDDPLTYTTSTLPAWLSFDPFAVTFHGTPSAQDEGNPEITLTAHSSSSSAASTFTFCVTHYPPPTVGLAISDQFHDSNPSLSSVFTLAPLSAIATSNPALRIPPKWSFSIGFESGTFKADHNLYYEARQADGSELPDWMTFNSKDITVNGFVPEKDLMSSPMTFALVLIASDQLGYKATSAPFDIVIADRELSGSQDPLPTINVTSAAPFTVSLLSSADFSGIFVDGKPIEPSDVTTLEMDTSGYGDWLKYDAPSRTLTGKPPADVTGTKPTIPVKLSTTFNQSINTNVSLALVPSYFSLSEFPALNLKPGDNVEFGVGQYLSNATAGGCNDADVSVTFDPTSAGNWMKYDSSQGLLMGTISTDSPPNHVSITYTAYSRITHSTSHATLNIYISDGSINHGKKSFHPSGLSVRARRKLVLALAICFGILGGLAVLACFFAVVRRYARVEDTALSGEEGRNGWSEKDRRWYGISGSPSHQEKAVDPLTLLQARSGRPPPNYVNLGLGLQRVAERSFSNPVAEVESPAVMRKREFMTKIKETVRQVSDKYTRKPRQYSRPLIGKPILVKSIIREEPIVYPLQGDPINPFDDVYSQGGSTFMSGSPSSSTGEHSIPRRRADFAPPRAFAQVHFDDQQLAPVSRQPSSASTGTVASHSSRRFAQSIQSGRSASPLSHESFPDIPETPATRPRLVPFTSSTRVPIPQANPAPIAGEPAAFTGNRIASQRAKVFKPGEDLTEVKESRSHDDLAMGLHYVRSLGADQLVSEKQGRSSDVGSIFYLLSCSHLDMT